MFIENISFSDIELNTATAIRKTISGVVINIEGRTSYYRTSKIEVDNGSGATINFVPMSENEYTIWNADSNYSDSFLLEDGNAKVIEDLKDGINSIICYGTAGHTSGVTFSVIKERW